MVKCLIELGTDINRICNRHETALFIACEKNKYNAIIKYLVDHWADVYIKVNLQ